MTDPQPIPPRGLVAGKYEVIRLIGRGGMGAVWEGRHASLGTRVAIKFIDAEYAESKDARARFETEARAAAGLQSKHAIQIYDHGVTEDGRPYMVMEMLGGEPLDERLDRVGRLSLQETARILGQVCRALQRAHDGGIIHRDMKPENIFLVRSPDDDDEIAKVLDFGIAKIKAAPGEQGLSSSTKTGAVLGTPYYMAPEQARGLRTIDHRADLWSLGIIAYKCVVGTLPFEGESVGDLLVKICTSPPPIPSHAGLGLPPAFDAWFARTMEREPANRFGSAYELAESLALAAGISVRRGPMSSQPHPNPQGYGPQITPSHRGVGAGTPLPTAGMTSAPFVTSAQPPKSSRGVVLAVLAAALVGGTVGVVAVVKLVSAAKTGQEVVAVLPTAAPSTAPSVSSAPVASAVALATTATAAPTPSETAAPPPSRPTTAPPGRGKPGPTGRPAPTLTIAQTAPTAAPTAAPTKPPVRSQPPSSDPGY